MMNPSTSLPEAFVLRLQSIVPENQWSQVVASFSAYPFTCFRVNTLKTSVEAVLSMLQGLHIDTAKIAWVENGFSISADQRELLTHSALAESGELYIQDAGSIFIAHLVGAKPGEEILDLAAAPGGKTLCLAGDMQNCGRIAAVEAVKSRFFQLKNNMQRCGVEIVECFLKDGRKVGKQVPARFDRVLLDAPCSSESRFSSRDPSTFQFWSVKKIADMQRKQKQLLYSAIQACKPGGRIVYSTCSFAPEENEMVVDRQLALWGDELEVLEIDTPFTNVQQGLLSWGKKSFDLRLQKSLRILPNGKMRGFFVCVLQKNKN